MAVCKARNCEIESIAKGYCQRHYDQLRRRGKIFKRFTTDPNQIVVRGNIAEISLYDVEGNEVAKTIIDSEDIEKIKIYKWYLDKYVQTKRGGKHLRIQHVIMGIASNMQILIDHKDRNPLNNLKSNLRFCTWRQNNQNRIEPAGNSSGYKGIFRAGKKWRAQIRVGNKTIDLGRFLKKEIAAFAYNKAAIKYYGEFAYLNDIQEIG